jgi:hypothetical protein
MKINKVLFVFGGVIIASVLLLLVLGLIAPNENHVERSIVIDAPIEDVRAKTMSFEAMLTWSPWAERDPNQKVTIENDGKVGALYTWDGADSLVGAGSQTITAMSPNKVVTHLHFRRPFESEADATTTLEPLGDTKTKVTWSYHDHTPYPLNVMNLFLDMDVLLGPDFDQGVRKLK